MRFEAEVGLPLAPESDAAEQAHLVVIAPEIGTRRAFAREFDLKRVR